MPTGNTELWRKERKGHNADMVDRVFCLKSNREIMDWALFAGAFLIFKRDILKDKIILY